MGIGGPAVIFHNGKYYLYSTGANRGYDVYTSSDMVNWQKGPWVLHTDERGSGHRIFQADYIKLL